MNLREFIVLRENGISLNEMPHVELFKNKDDYFVVDFRSEDGLSWIGNVIKLFVKRETLGFDGSIIKLPQSKMLEIEDNLSKNMFFINILKKDLHNYKDKTEVLKQLPQKIKQKLGIV